MISSHPIALSLPIADRRGGFRLLRRRIGLAVGGGADRRRAGASIVTAPGPQSWGYAGALSQPQREASEAFLEGQGWGFGGSVDVQPIDSWNMPGRYGWIGGTGTAAHITAVTGVITILLSQLEMTSLSVSAVVRDFWRYAASVT